MDLRKLAKNALQPIEKKLKGMYTKEANRKDRRDKEISTSNLVQMLIEESTDKRNLSVHCEMFLIAMTDEVWQGKMYPGWAAWH